MPSNKIKYGLDKLYYAPITAWDAQTGEPTYGTPVAIPGARSISLSAEGDVNKWYADNIVYWSGEANNGYSGSFEVAMLPEAFKKDILGQALDSKNVLYEDMNAQTVHFALMFQFKGDQNAIRHVLYNCTASRPDMEGNTKEESIDPQTDTVEIECASVPVEISTGVFKEVVKGSSGDSTDSTTYNGWFSVVYVPSGSPSATTT